MKLQPDIREMYFWQAWNGLSLSYQATSGKGSKEYREYCGILPKPGGVGCVHSWGWTGIGWKKGKSWRNFKFCRSLLSSIPIPVQPLVHSPQIPKIQNFSSDRSHRGAEKSCHGWQLQNYTRFLSKAKDLLSKSGDFTVHATLDADLTGETVLM